MATPPNYGSVPYGANIVPPKKRRAWPYIVAALAVALVYAIGVLVWSINSYRPKAAAFANSFHQELNQEHFDQIYEKADQRFRDAVTKEDFAKLLEHIHSKLGDAHETSVTNVAINATTNGKFVIATMNTKFEHDPATTETFTFLASGETLSLVGYRVNSNLLVEK
jgi:hypothetical protein